MMRRLLILQNWSLFSLFAGLAGSAVALAWLTFNLFGMALSNIRFISLYGTMGLADGGFLQFLELSCYGLISLLMYVLFKGCETEIIKRWRDLHGSTEKSDETEDI